MIAVPKIAGRATLDLKQRKLFVDGVEFPWVLSEEGPSFGNLGGANDVRSVTLTFFTEDVEVIPEFD